MLSVSSRHVDNTKITNERQTCVGTSGGGSSVPAPGQQPGQLGIPRKLNKLNKTKAIDKNGNQICI